jgi:hypothetical protein
MNEKEKSFGLVTTKSLAIITLIVATISVWLLGLGQHRSLFENSIITISILSIAFFSFISIGLYKGVKIKENVGKLTDHIKKSSPGFLNIKSIADFISPADGIEGIVVGVLLWIFVAIFCAFFLWLFGAVLWFGVIVFAAMLYWIFFRALRLVFKNSNKCKGQIMKSVSYGLFYTFLYIIWIYLIILAVKYFTS